MPTFRFADPEGAVHHGLLHSDGSRERLEGSLFEHQRPSGEAAAVARLLAPLEPRALICIGFNYRRHAAETGAAIPQRPVVFMKSPGAVQDQDALILVKNCCNVNVLSALKKKFMVPENLLCITWLEK
jgi:2-keto-4-pentenoate hydratase/2-oxohepta-3-ene-1,7-dioic acid hydratase in catechol pathway